MGHVTSVLPADQSRVATSAARPVLQDAATQAILDKLNRIESSLNALLQQRTVKDWYTVEEFSQILGKAEFTCREWCRNGRIHARKRKSGRGKFCSWVISHDELLRYQREGLLPENRGDRGLLR